MTGIWTAKLVVVTQTSVRAVCHRAVTGLQPSSDPGNRAGVRVYLSNLTGVGRTEWVSSVCVVTDTNVSHTVPGSVGSTGSLEEVLLVILVLCEEVFWFCVRRFSGSV